MRLISNNHKKIEMTRNDRRINAASNRDEETTKERERERKGKKKKEMKAKSCWTVATRRFESNDLVIVLPREAKDLR